MASGRLRAFSKKLASHPKRPKRRVQRIPPSVQVLTTTASADGPKKVVIDGVIFQFEEDGTKLTRIGGELHSSERERL